MIKYIHKKETMKIVIVGAGPSGLFLVHRLLNRDSNYEIHIFERKESPNNLEYSDERDFGFGLGKKAKKSLQTVKKIWEEIIKKSIKLTLGELWLIPRRQLCKVLLNLLKEQEAESISKGKLKIEFKANVLQVDFKNHKILVEKKDSQEWVSYDLLVGADGINSKIRDAMILSNPNEINFKQKKRPQVWKVLQLGEQTKLTSKYSNNLIRLEKKNLEFGASFGAIVPQKEGIFNALIFWSPVNGKSEVNPCGVDTKEKIQQLLEEMLPKSVPSIKLDDNKAENFLKTKPSYEYWSKCDCYHNLKGKAVLIGDAAHNMFSILGQGCTAALADVVVLDELLEQYQNDVSIVLPKFSELQVKEGHAASDLNLIALVLYNPIFRKIYKFASIIWVGILNQPIIFSETNQLNNNYTAVLNKNKVWIWLARKMFEKN